jgi:hypothetical protein
MPAYEDSIREWRGEQSERQCQSEGETMGL